jgi:hypothetical protein
MMFPEDEADRLQRAFSTFDGEPPIGGCPEADAIWMAVRAELPSDATRAIVLHTAACASCAEAWRIAHGARQRTAQPVAAPAWRSVWVWGPGLAAAALLLVSLLNQSAISLPGRRPSPQYREQVAPVVTALVADAQPLDRAAFVLRWTPGPDGAHYNVRVTTEDLTVIARAWSLGAPQYQVPPASLAALPAGTRLLWQVDVLARDQPRRSSSTFTVLLR